MTVVNQLLGVLFVNWLCVQILTIRCMRDPLFTPLVNGDPGPCQGINNVLFSTGT